MTRLTAFGIIVALIIIGAIEKIISIRKLSQRLEYTSKYRNDFIVFCNRVRETHKLEGDDYYKLMQDENKIQRELGVNGIISVYQDPAAGIQMNNYPIFLNFFGELRNYMTSPYLFEERIYLLVSTCDEALTKHIGVLKEAIEIGYSKLKNPFACFANGMSFIISLPVRILEWCGVINSDTSKRILNSRLQEIINKIVVLIGLISSMITIIMGWDIFIQIVKTLLRFG